MSLFKIHDRLYVTLGDYEKAVIATQDLYTPLSFTAASEQTNALGPAFRANPVSLLSAIEDFCAHLASEIETQTTDAIFVVHASSDDSKAKTSACIMVGAYLILSVGFGLGVVQQSFQACLEELDALHTGSTRTTPCNIVVNCWSALDHALQLGWLVGPSSQAEPLFDAEEFDHYAHPANGSVHILAPRSLYVFAAPEDLDGGLAWTDTAPDPAHGGRVSRLFSPTFCADLLADLGTSAVLYLEVAPTSAARAFAARGLTVHGQRVNVGQPSPLAALDGLLSAARDGRGVAVAVAGFGRGGGPEWMPLLVTAFLVSRHGFGPGSAEAWVWMVCPRLVEAFGGL